MATPPESTKTSLAQRLRAHARDRWPNSPTSAFVTTAASPTSTDAHLPDGTVLPLCRLRYGGYANQRGFAIYLASKNKYQDSILPSGMPAVRRH